MATLLFNAAEKPSAKTRTQLEKDLQAFEEMSVPIRRQNQLVWWVEQSETLSCLSAIACAIITCPATEVSVERLFSHLKLILTERRSRLSENLLEDVLFLLTGCPKFNFLCSEPIKKN